MNPGGNTELAASAIALAAAVDGLLGSSLDPHSDDEFIAVMREVEASVRKLEAVKHRFTSEVSTRSLPGRYGSPTPAAFLRQTLHLSNADAVSRVRAADKLAVQTFTTGILEAPLAYVAEAQREGAISGDHARQIMAIMNRLPSELDMGKKEVAEEILTDYARNGFPDALPRLGEEIMMRVDPDGQLAKDADRQRMRGITIGRQRADGMSTVSGELTPTLRAVLDPVLAKLARPGMCNPDDPESPWTADESIHREVVEAAAKRDTRSAAQRTHDALLGFLRPEIGTTNLGSHRGLPVSTVITMSIGEVERAAGVVTTASGGTVSVPEALKLASKSIPYLAIFDPNGMPLHLSGKRVGTKAHRLATKAQRLALTAAEKGCTRPECDAPATMAAVHHIVEWAKGGPTDIENLTLACDSCHALVHDGPGGWKTVVMGPETDYPGRTGWIAPSHIDPTGTPRVNHRHHPGELMAASLARIQERDRCAADRRKQWLNRRNATLKQGSPSGAPPWVPGPS
ncbi:DUF222 domain-containing protein [Nocardia sp. NPDC058058]|uniref:HNH endonuclease signature motif containing protein n=1 Tax=Nocardia sp. NPDC058058 TaxID=3346317 RepID=UPI0036DB59DE